MQIKVMSKEKTIVFELNESTAAKSLCEQLPITIKVENFSNNEKVFYPEKKLNIRNTPLANAKTGTLAYYAPWGDVVMFYKDFGTGSGLYELGKAISGKEHIRELSEIIEITQV